MKLRITILTLLLAFSVNGFTQKSTQTNEEGSDEIIKEKMPQFPGGNNAFHNYLDKNVLLPEGFDAAAYVKKHGNQFVTVSVAFTIDVDGSIIEVKVTDSEDKLLDEKAKKIVENMPKWDRGYKEGKPVKVQYAIPVRFNLM